MRSSVQHIPITCRAKVASGRFIRQRRDAGGRAIAFTSACELLCVLLQNSSSSFSIFLFLPGLFGIFDLWPSACSFTIQDVASIRAFELSSLVRRRPFEPSESGFTCTKRLAGQIFQALFFECAPVRGRAEVDEAQQESPVCLRCPSFVCCRGCHRSDW